MNFSETILLTLGNSLLLAGAFWGSSNTRIKVLEREIRETKHFDTRIARLEEKIDFLINNIVKNEKHT